MPVAAALPAPIYLESQMQNLRVEGHILTSGQIWVPEALPPVVERAVEAICGGDRGLEAGAPVGEARARGLEDDCRRAPEVAHEVRVEEQHQRVGDQVPAWRQVDDARRLLVQLTVLVAAVVDLSPRLLWRELQRVVVLSEIERCLNGGGVVGDPRRPWRRSVGP
jgi:hypothetical protein